MAVAAIGDTRVRNEEWQGGGRKGAGSWGWESGGRLGEGIEGTLTQPCVTRSWAGGSVELWGHCRLPGWMEVLSQLSFPGTCDGREECL